MKNKSFKLIKYTVACSIVVICTIAGLNTDKSTNGEFTLKELVNTPNANASCESIEQLNRGRCGISNNCFWNDSYAECYPWAY